MSSTTALAQMENVDESIVVKIRIRGPGIP